MASINDISIAINSLFMDITEPITLGLNISNFLKTYKNTFFKHTNNDDFEFNLNPILQFDNSTVLTDFLKREQLLSTRFQDQTSEYNIEDLVNEKDDTLTLDNFFLNYSIEINGDEILIFFATNSLVFKYEVIG